MRWWCSALLGQPWTWRWQAYPGVWLFILGLGLAYAWALLRLPAPRLAGDERPTSAPELVLIGLGLLVLWAGLDWPVGVLAAGYLLSVKTLQYLLIGYIAPGLMLLGTPRWLLRRMIRGRVVFLVARALTRPLIPLAVANGVLVATHLPVVVDNVAGSQLWTLVLDLVVIAAGFIFWWPALGRLPELHPMSYGARIGYLGLNVFLPTVPASFFTFSQYPIYGLYELAPRVSGISAVADQRVAGLLMKTGGGALLFGTMSVMFFRWFRHEAEPEGVLVPSPPGGEGPGR
ncbi:MAG: cytochrome c oxidase assembly protein [Gemmatimonadetes bacterium]|nr:cytochrome c oxidase assembly protein [Gemmatimonadota bacterium]